MSIPLPAIAVFVVFLLGPRVVAFAEQQLLLGGEDGAAALASAAAATTTTTSRAATPFSAAATDVAATALTTSSSNNNNDDILVLTAAAALGRSRESAVVHWQEALRRDADLRFSPQTNQLVYACTGLGIHAPTGLIADAPRLASALSSSKYINNINTTTAATLIAAIVGDPSSFAFPDELDPSTADAFRLHSRPGATKKIVLDFTGHTLRPGTWWSKNNPNGVTAPIVAPPWSLDTDRAFSTTELKHIVSIWRNIAEDYASWDVDVTTEQPSGTDDQGDALLVGRGVRVVIGANTGWWLSEAGGIAFVTAFGVKESGPVAFIFNQDPLGVARAVSHEVGHTLGLGHHGNVAHGSVAANEYYMGHRQWAPVMGVGYYTNVVQWSKGDYPYASNPTQDDIKVISNYLAPILTRQGGGAGASTATAVALAPPLSASTPTSVTGVMLASTELLVFKFRMSAAGRVTLALSVTAPGTYGARTHLAARVRVFSANTASVVGTQFENVGATGIDNNNAETPAYAFDVPAAGLYYVELSATGNGDFANYGYSAYGSSGTFMLTLGCTTPGLVGDAGALPPQPPLPNPPTPPPAPQGATTDSITCTSPTYNLTAGKCGASVTVASADLYSLSSGSGSGGAVTTTLPSSSGGGGLLGPGVHRIDVIATNGGSKCTAVVTVQPCRPVVVAVSTTAGVRVPTQRGSCGGILTPAQAVSAATLGQGALGINARTSATSAIIPQPLPAGRYFVHVVYPGGLVSAVSARPLPVKIIDVEAPVAIIKPTIARNSGGGSGFICARGRYSVSSTACLSMSTSTSVVMLSDNCQVSKLKRRYSCLGAFCPAGSTMRPAASRLCVPVVRGGGRREVVFTLAVTDRGGNMGAVRIPVAAYHYDDAPDVAAGVTCYYD